ncbi:uncharacterized protein LOC121864609 [Homarus americanus]|uniref:uncharacterized protein LOC121864609 n=1 Tax=Homarus americanus TaxID=6706 RepID=UPI001C460E46|nr:uncharacterized protein LOC121864609 [Homarus americanus]
MVTEGTHLCQCYSYFSAPTRSTASTQSWLRNLLLVLLTLHLAPWPHRNLVVAAASSSDADRLHSALLELTTVLRGLRSDLRDGFDHLASELHQERLSREELTHILRDQVNDNRRALENVRSDITFLSTTTGDGCPGNPSDGAGERDKTVLGREDGVGSNHGTIDNNTARGGGGGAGGEEEAATQPPPTIDCPAPFELVGSDCLTLLKERTLWEAARARCHSYALSVVGKWTGSRQVRGDLVVPHDMEPFKDFVAATDFDGAPSGWAWVGGSTEGWGGVWAWVDGSLMKELPWLYSQRTGGGVARRGQ